MDLFFPETPGPVEIKDCEAIFYPFLDFAFKDGYWLNSVY